MKTEHDLMLVIGSLLLSISNLQRQCAEMKRILAEQLEDIGPAERSGLLEDASELELLSAKSRQEAVLFLPCDAVAAIAS